MKNTKKYIKHPPTSLHPLKFEEATKLLFQVKKENVLPVGNIPVVKVPMPKKK